MTEPALDSLIEEITVDAYDDEGFDAFAYYFSDEVGLPLSRRVIGQEIEVIDVFFDGDKRRGLSARCLRGTDAHDVALLDVVFAAGSVEIEYWPPNANGSDLTHGPEMSQ
jgi:hypothetical protein